MIQRRTLLVCNVGRWDALETYLAITRREGHPSGARPPGDDEAEEPAVLGTRTFSGPDVDRTAKRESRADLGKHSSSDPHEDHRDDVRGPEAILAHFTSSW